MRRPDQWSYSVYEATVKDEAAYTAALPEVEKLLKEHGAQRVAGGFNKTVTMSGAPVGNRYVIIKWDDMASFEKSYNGGIKAWIEKNAPDAVQFCCASRRCSKCAVKQIVTPNVPQGRGRSDTATYQTGAISTRTRGEGLQIRLLAGSTPPLYEYPSFFCGPRRATMDGNIRAPNVACV